MSANDVTCKGPGGKRVEDGIDILPRGLSLPSHVSHKHVYFFAGVETAPRVCGPWAFNASSISWFFVNAHDEAISDEQLGIQILPGFLYLTYSHFSDFCVFQKKLDKPFDYSTKQEQAQEEAHKEKEKNEREPNAQNPVCFPSEAALLAEDGRRVLMKDLAIGDRVLTSSNLTYSDVFLFTHQDHSAVAPFVQISTESGAHIVLSGSHYLYLNNRIQAADAAKIGDFVTLESGAKDLVVNVESVWARGLYHPQTMDGNIVVNGILATTWTRAAAPATASSLLVPVRGIYHLLPSSLFSIIRLLVETSVDCIRPLYTLVNSLPN
ncbi:hypothetical protein FGB62_25g526 [Gracilaria domingensis]|nr:hypothetical protein FGB62_25g526 [Gracilaria domingensis]